MKYFFILVFCLFSFQMDAQTVGSIWFPSQPIQVQSTSQIESTLFNLFDELHQQDISLHLIHQQKALASSHYEFELMYQGIPIFNASIKVHTDLKGNILSIKKEFQHLNLLQGYQPSDEIMAWSKKDLQQESMPYWDPSYVINDSYPAIQLNNSKACVVMVINSWNQTHDYTLVLNLDGTKEDLFNNSRYSNIDTVVHVRVFNPDPLTTLGLNYGGIYIDNNDANDTWMNPAYVDTMVRATFDNSTNTFYLENPYIIIDDIEAPSIAPVTSSTPYFIYDRSQTGFEDANACYHITTFHDYISSIGYDTLMDLQLVVDTHAQNGADNSVFHQNGGTPNIAYGQGGVDDAEDADVLIHEYSHGLSWSANHNSTFSFERSGLDEGLADYFATSYSRTINPFNWEKVFSWDGPIWGGRIANTTSNYPSTGGNYYKVGEIWNSAMSAIWTDLGAIVTDKLMLESLHFFTNNTTLPEAAIYVLEADTALFGGIHANTICSKFQARNILNSDCKPVGIANTPESKIVRLENTLGFSNRSGDAILRFTENCNGKFELYNMYGQVEMQQSFMNQDHIAVSSSKIPSGIYILKVNSTKENLSFTLVVN